jgi:Skp family chaperone for outer membrane proteins
MPDQQLGVEAQLRAGLEGSYAQSAPVEGAPPAPVAPQQPVNPQGQQQTTPEAPPADSRQGAETPVQPIDPSQLSHGAELPNGLRVIDPKQAVDLTPFESFQKYQATMERRLQAIQAQINERTQQTEVEQTEEQLKARLRDRLKAAKSEPERIKAVHDYHLEREAEAGKRAEAQREQERLRNTLSSLDNGLRQAGADQDFLRAIHAQSVQGARDEQGQLDPYRYQAIKMGNLVTYFARALAGHAPNPFKPLAEQQEILNRMQGQQPTNAATGQPAQQPQTYGQPQYGQPQDTRVAMPPTLGGTGEPDLMKLFSDSDFEALNERLRR